MARTNDDGAWKRKRAAREAKAIVKLAHTLSDWRVTHAQTLRTREHEPFTERDEALMTVTPQAITRWLHGVEGQEDEMPQSVAVWLLREAVLDRMETLPDEDEDE